jgi:hypothetical protein
MRNNKMSNSNNNGTRENTYGVMRGRGVEMRLASSVTRKTDIDELWRVLAAHAKATTSEHSATGSL